MKLGVRNADGNDGFEYVGSLVYRRTPSGLELESASFGGGRIIASQGPTTTYTPNYFLTDHLGSTRVVVDANGTTQQRNDYYAFGERWAYTGSQYSDNRYLFSGKEDQVSLGLPYSDFGARMLDKKLGRWSSIDPLTENKYWLNPYHYCSNNPVNRIDPNGLDDYFDKWGKFLRSDNKATNNIYVMYGSQNVLLSEVSLNTHSALVRNVAMYYGRDIGHNNPLDFSAERQNALAFTRGDMIYLSDFDGHISPTLDDAYAMRSTILHEKGHFDKKHGWSNEKGETYTSYDHAEVFNKQLGDDSFKKAPEKYQKGVLRTLSRELSNAINIDDESLVKVDDLLNRINDNLVGTQFYLQGGFNYQDYEVNIRYR